MENTTQENSRPKNGLGAANIAFIVFLVAAMVGVAWVGRLAYLEGVKGEVTKRNGEAWAKWLAQAGLDRSKPGYEPSACATGFIPVAAPVTPAQAPVETYSEAYVAEPPVASAVLMPKESPVARTWGPCFKALTTAGGSMASFLNPFTEKPLVIVPKCDIADRSLAGSMTLDKTIATPPGSAVPFLSSSLTETDSIEQKMQVKVTMCDKGAYPIRIAELEF